MDSKMIVALKNYTILFAEDELGIQEEIEEILTLIFNRVYIASDGIEAKELYLEFKPDLIISDIKMPKLTGLQLAQKIRQNDDETFIAIVSAYTDLDLMLQATELNLLKYIVKPITKSKLMELFKLFLEKKASQGVIHLSHDFIFYRNISVVMNHEIKHKLTSREFDFLILLLKKRAIVTYSEIEDILQTEDFYSHHAMRQFIKKLRQKLPENFLKNIQNQGYSITKEFL